MTQSKGDKSMSLRERIENDKLYQLLIKIKEKPEMFLGDADLNILHGWIIGYNLYKTLHSIKSDIDLLEIDNNISFDEYVHNHYDNYTTIGWLKLITFYSWNKRSSLETFFDLLFEYIDYCCNKE